MIVVGGLAVVIAAAFFGGEATDPIGPAFEADAAIATDAGQAEINAQPRPPARQARPPEREHGTDGLMGVLPFRAMLAAHAAEVDAPASTRDGAIRRNGGLVWPTDAYAE